MSVPPTVTELVFAGVRPDDDEHRRTREVWGPVAVHEEQSQGDAALTKLRAMLADGLARKGLTVTQLARRAELGRTTVHEALQPGGPVPSHRTVAALAHALGLPEEELLNLRRVAAGEAPAVRPAPRRARVVAITAGLTVLVAGSAYGTYAATHSPGTPHPQARSSAPATHPAPPSGTGSPSAELGQADTSSPAGPRNNDAGLPASERPQIQIVGSGCYAAHYYTSTAAQYMHNIRSGEQGLGPSVIDITSQTASAEAVLMTGIKVFVLHRAPLPTSGITVDDGQCGEVQAVRPFTTDLNRPQPVLIAKPDPGGPGDPGHPPVKFPFRISRTDPEVFEITTSGNCDCRYAFEVDWVAAGKSGSTVVGAANGGLRVLGGAHVPAYKLADGSYNKIVPVGR
ncbi:helix-turn-helix transcriptional regulator [Streptomyces sp. NPDC051104]|uniref:helix-turn-helix domain-containing protein n=1 Tax=Streptomyces sp. NPDC051104 TaxID=3155044 RepID=UPI003412F192